MSSAINCIILDDFEAHEAALQRVVEDDHEKREKEAINDKKKRAIMAAEDESDQEFKKAKDNNEEKVAAILAAMQRDLARLPLLRQIYHEALDDVFELIVSKCCQLDEYGLGLGGLNAFRLANKRFEKVVESCTTRLTNPQEADGPDSLPLSIIQKCRRIETI
jgi:hypothetical protein